VLVERKPVQIAREVEEETDELCPEVYGHCSYEIKSS
jgi:hypothetical protein